MDSVLGARTTLLRSRARRRASTLVLALALLAACERAPRAEQVVAPASASDAGIRAAATLADSAALAQNEPAPAVDAGPPLEFTGTIRGVVKLAKGQKLPLGLFPQQNGVTPPSASKCPPIDTADQRTVTVAKQTGGLSPVHVALTGMTGSPPRAPVVHELYIDGCRLRPTLVGALRGDRVRVTNRSEAAFVPRLPGGNFMRGLMHGESTEAELKETRSLIECSFAAYCGESLVVATSHSLYDVTTPEGFFAIEHVPLDQELNVHAWHPLFQVSSSESITLTHAQPEKMIELTLTPSAGALAIKPGPPQVVKAPVIVERLKDGGVVVHTKGPAYE